MEFNPNFTCMLQSAAAEENVHHKKSKHSYAMMLKTVTGGFLIHYDRNIPTQE
jgi:hypothetical protein